MKRFAEEILAKIDAEIQLSDLFVAVWIAKRQ